MSGVYTRTNGAQVTRDPVQPRFHIEPVPDPVATAQQGRPIFREEERVQYMMPGGLSQPVERVNDEHRARWPEQYKQFKAGHDMATTGTPLEQWPILSRAMVLEMKALNIFTVEQCAELSDTACQRIPRAGYRVRELAKAYLDDAEAGALTSKLAAENDALHSRISESDRKVDELKELVDRLHSQLMTLQNAPNPIAAYVPGMHDPMEAAKQYAPTTPAPEPSALDALAAPRRGPGRHRKDESAAEAA